MSESREVAAFHYELKDITYVETEMFGRMLVNDTYEVIARIEKHKLNYLHWLCNQENKEIELIFRLKEE